MNFPLWITNAKNYEQCVGHNAVTMAQAHERAQKISGKNIAFSVNALDAGIVAEKTDVQLVAQHVDNIDYGQGTGKILPQAIKNYGMNMTLLNHSERRIDPETIQETIQKCHAHGIQVVLCVESPEELKEYAQFSPDFLAFEPPELIGSTSGASVSTEKPESIAESVKNAGDIPVLVGAGISSKKDVEVALSLGAKGFLVASAIVKAQNPEEKLLEFMEAF